MPAGNFSADGGSLIDDLANKFKLNQIAKDILTGRAPGMTSEQLENLARELAKNPKFIRPASWASRGAAPRGPRGRGGRPGGPRGGGLFGALIALVAILLADRKAEAVGDAIEGVLGGSSGGPPADWEYCGKCGHKWRRGVGETCGCPAVPGKQPAYPSDYDGTWKWKQNEFGTWYRDYYWQSPSNPLPLPPLPGAKPWPPTPPAPELPPEFHNPGPGISIVQQSGDQAQASSGTGSTQVPPDIFDPILNSCRTPDASAPTEPELPPKSAEHQSGSGLGNVAETTSAAPIIHVVQRGESLFRISIRYGVTIAELSAVNRLESGEILVGQRLMIPSRPGAPNDAGRFGPSFLVGLSRVPGIRLAAVGMLAVVMAVACYFSPLAADLWTYGFTGHGAPPFISFVDEPEVSGETVIWWSNGSVPQQADGDCPQSSGSLDDDCSCTGDCNVSPTPDAPCSPPNTDDGYDCDDAADADCDDANASGNTCDECGTTRCEPAGSDGCDSCAPNAPCEPGGGNAPCNPPDTDDGYDCDDKADAGCNPAVADCGDVDDCDDDADCDAAAAAGFACDDCDGVDDDCDDAADAGSADDFGDILPDTTICNGVLVAGDLLADGETTYVVQSGDTLHAIATRFGIAIQDIMRRNYLPKPDMIWVGQTLIIPIGSGSAGGTSGASGGGAASTDGASSAGEGAGQESGGGQTQETPKEHASDPQPTPRPTEPPPTDGDTATPPSKP